MNKVAFLITSYDTIREVYYSVDMFRNKWESTKTAPIVIVITGDPDNKLRFDNDPYTRVVHLKDIVGSNFNAMVSTSIMRQISHGMLEIRDLEREVGPISSVVHFHGDILFLNERGFWVEFDRWQASHKFMACDTVGPQGPYPMEYDGKKFSLEFTGNEIMPQVFAVKHRGFQDSDRPFMYCMDIDGLEEKFSTEKALWGNLLRAGYDAGDVHYVCRHRPTQWGVHKHWGSFVHYGNQLHCPREQREAKNKAVLEACGLDLEVWNASR